MAAYMVASRIIFHTEGLSFADIELLRTPFRLTAALLFWLLMADVMFARQPNMQVARRKSFMLALAFLFATPLLVLAHGMPADEAAIVAVTSLPVALCEEFFFRGILQAMLVRHMGAVLGIIVTIVCFTAFHVGASLDTAWNYSLLSLVGVSFCLIYFKTGSLMLVVLVHAIYDALACAMSQPVLSMPWAPVFLLFAWVALLQWATAESPLNFTHAEDRQK